MEKMQKRWLDDCSGLGIGNTYTYIPFSAWAEGEGRTLDDFTRWRIFYDVKIFDFRIASKHFLWFVRAIRFKPFQKILLTTFYIRECKQSSVKLYFHFATSNLSINFLCEMGTRCVGMYVRRLYQLIRINHSESRIVNYELLSQIVSSMESKIGFSHLSRDNGSISTYYLHIVAKAGQLLSVALNTGTRETEPEPPSEFMGFPYSEPFSLTCEFVAWILLLS